MGTNGSKDSGNLDTDIYNIDSIQKHIDSFSTTNDVNRQQFVEFLFSRFDEVSHPRLGRIVISNTYIMELFFLFLSNHNKDAKIHTSQIKSRINKMFKDPQKAIDYSFRLIDLNDDKKISKAEFLAFIDNSLASLLHAAEKRFVNQEDFKISFKTWIKSNKMKFIQGFVKIFEEYAKTNPEYWQYGDYKRWIKQKKYWTLDINIGAEVLRTPLNLLCLFNLEA